MSEINWAVELRKYEREFEGLPPEPEPVRRPSRTQIRLEKIKEITAKQRFQERLSLYGVWARLFLIASLALSLFWWPYGQRCGFPLVAFLISNTMVIVGGLSLSVRTWRDRMPWPFAGSTLFVVVAWTAIALHTLPRLGYAPLGGASAGWSCVAQR